MDSTLIITDELNSFDVTRRVAIDIELKLNKTEYGRPWSHIGDVLYDFGAKNKHTGNLIVTSFQYEFLKEIFDSLNHL